MRGLEHRCGRGLLAAALAVAWGCAGSGAGSSQRYTLQAPMSGKKRIPPLRIELLDQRRGEAIEGEPDADEIEGDCLESFPVPVRK